MKDNQYWINRSKNRMKKYHKDSNGTINIITNAYDKAIEDIEEDIRKIFDKYALDGSLSPIESKRYLNQKIPNFILELMRKYYPKIKNEDIKRWMLSKINAPAYKARMTRLEALKESIYIRSKEIADVEIQASTSQYIGTINQAYYRNMFDIQKGIGMGFDFAAMPSQIIETILKSPWSGKQFSERIWNNTDILAEQLTEILTSGFMTGKSIDKMARELKDVAHVGKYVATRLIRTETTYMANTAEIESYKECDIEKYIYIATLDLRTSKECRELDRQVFEVLEAVAGENLPPMHPNCRSTTRAWLGEDTLKDIERRARDPKTGKTYLIPADMNYEEWYQKYVIDKYGQDQAKAMEKKIRNKASDKIQHDKYKLIFGDEVPSKLDDFQELKYNDIEEWEDVKAKKQDTLNSLDYKDSFFGRFGDKEVREWYITHDENIPNLIDKSKDIEVQAREAHGFRNKYRTEARNMMKDQVTRVELDKDRPNKSFDELLDYKMGNKKITREEAIKDIFKTATKTNIEVNKSLGLE